VSISLMNLVTAVLVEGALEHARQEKEEEILMSNEKVKLMIPQLKQLFEDLDKDNSGDLHQAEIEQAEREGRVVVPEHILDKASVGSMTELFLNLDVDKSGKLTCAEFIEGCMNIFLLDIPVRDMMMMKMIRLLRHGVMKIEGEIRDLKRSMVLASSAK
ncbi:Voltage-dependent T-type calcium channel subunit alpha-1H, partial [Durusdinium trenchii]